MNRASSLPAPLAWIDGITERLGKTLAWLVLIMMLVEFLIVVLRYLFNFNSIPMQESVMYLHAVVFLLAASYTLKHDGHVRVDIFYRGMTAKKKAWVDLLGTLFLLMPVMIFVVLTSLGYVGKSWRILEGSPESGGLPGVFLLKTLIPIFAGLMCLQGVVEIARNGLIIAGRLPPRDDEDHAEERL
ncbi:TRAP-type mannitol/chloroaromatic compound transport system, small permease component [Modicisalibacter ilicicola DSM 19980]|uniref:TRAP transporter small permease protein n=1 Tax=Modicisalibacter ilicicola DSM 19980 TaxID=1121942 RepID=A0A1M5AHL3_9GAMM|nr:TRAP transporter small permease subunit [Halomonas ilicicola]SHF29779.1 TRAP-type mannitol/chloroaromatic compound transport system, small permease component [Halomonas ilicicola DSM 19980]